MVFAVIPAIVAVIARLIVQMLNAVRHVDNNVASVS